MSGPVRRLPKWLDRAGFEADKLMRANRVRVEQGKLKDEADARHLELSTKVMQLAAAGVELPEEIRQIVADITALNAEIGRKEDDVRAISAETWIEGVVVTAAPTTVADPIAQRLQAYVEAKNNDFNCPACGTVIRANKSFCPKCGRKVLR